VQSTAATSGGPAERSAIIAIVDDDPAVCASLKFSLEREGFVVRAYGNVGDF